MNEPQRGLEPGKIASLGGLVEYQPGAVVSRMIVFKRSGTITLFAFDEGQGLSEHTAPFDAIVTVLEGRARVTIRDQEFALGAGEVIVMPASVPHAVYATTRFKMELVMIHE
jgi:quercetin dioxygenase-like cupin family protein